MKNIILICCQIIFIVKLIAYKDIKTSTTNMNILINLQHSFAYQTLHILLHKFTVSNNFLYLLQTHTTPAIELYNLKKKEKKLIILLFIINYNSVKQLQCL